MITVDRDRLYALLTAKSGITRRRDPRLEVIARDRALEARYTVGTTGSAGIPHPIDQLKARTWPLQGTFKGVWENAMWSYANDFIADPEQAAADGWWASSAHRANLARPEATHWGVGAHVEPPVGAQTNPRIYLINVLTRDLMTTAFVATGTDYPDALAAGPKAAGLGASIFLTRKSDLPAVTRSALVALKPSEIVIVGGTGAVSASVATELASIAPVRRLAGADRYATAVAVSQA